MLPSSKAERIVPNGRATCFYWPSKYNTTIQYGNQSSVKCVFINTWLMKVGRRKIEKATTRGSSGVKGALPFPGYVPGSLYPGH